MTTTEEQIADQINKVFDEFGWKEVKMAVATNMAKKEIE
jgi:hypothetical protein